MTLCEGFTVFEPMAQAAPTNPFEDIQAKAKADYKERKIHLEQKRPNKAKEKKHPNPLWKKQKQI
jgi:hypothetical protein